MSATRRELIVGGGCALIAAVVPGNAARAWGATPRLLTDDPEFTGGAAVSVEASGFIDDAFVAALPSGAYTTRLSPANSLLLLEVLRSRRIAAAEDGSFTIGRRA